jgi:putative ABC transport system permease protein
MFKDFTKFFKSIKLAFAGLAANKTRTALSVLGIVIGVAAVIMIVSMGQGLQNLIMGQFSSLGTDVASIQTKVPGEGYGGSMTSRGQGVLVTTLKESDAEALRNRDRFPYITVVGGDSVSQATVRYEDSKKTVYLVAADSYYPSIDSAVAAEKGRFFTEDEDKGLAKVAVIGKDLATEFFGADDPIGKDIKIKNDSFKVVGVLKARGAMLSVNMDEMVIIPLATSQKTLDGIDYIQEIALKLTDKKYLPQAKDDITLLLRERHKINRPSDDDFQIVTMDEAMTTISSITSAISLLLGLLAAISLFVGGVGIMNIMLVIVAERTREIGLRKAVGARYKDIMRQFVFEAVAISLLGGFIGVVVGIFFSFIISLLITRYGGLNWPFTVSIPAIIISFAVAAFFGIVFGWYPAKEAAQLSPIEALRKN